MASRSQFLNLNPRRGPLPAILAIPNRGKMYFARVVHAERDHCNTPFARRPEPYKHDHYHIVLVTKGEGSFHIEGTEQRVGPGDVFFTSPPQRHSFFNVGRNRASYSEITFEFLNAKGQPLEITFDEMLSAWTNQPCRALYRTRSSAVFRHTFLTVVESFVARSAPARPISDLESNAILWSLLMAVFEEIFRAVEVPRTQPLDALRDHILHHYQDELSLSGLADRAGVTANYLSRRFKQLYGRTPIDFQLDLRIRSACTLLRTADHTLADIAAGVGFQDVCYFSRLFKRRVGVSPGRYRKRG